MGYKFNKPKGGYIRHDGQMNLMVKEVDVDPKTGIPMLVKVVFMNAAGDLLNNKYDLTNRGAQFAFSALLEAAYPEVTDGEYEWSPETLVGKFVDANLTLKYDASSDREYCNLGRINGPGTPFADPDAPSGNSLI